LSYGRVGLL